MHIWHLLLKHDGGLLLHLSRRGCRCEHGLRDVLWLLVHELVAGGLRSRVGNASVIAKVVDLAHWHALRVRSKVAVISVLSSLFWVVVEEGLLAYWLSHVLVLHCKWI